MRAWVILHIIIFHMTHFTQASTIPNWETINLLVLPQLREKAVLCWQYSPGSWNVLHPCETKKWIKQTGRAYVYIRGVMGRESLNVCERQNYQVIEQSRRISMRSSPCSVACDPKAVSLWNHSCHYQLLSPNEIPRQAWRWHHTPPLSVLVYLPTLRLYLTRWLGDWIRQHWQFYQWPFQYKTT